MVEEIPTLAQLLRVLQHVPYLASKNLYRVVTHFLDMDEQQMKQFCTVLENAKSKLGKCAICFYWQEVGRDCIFCSSSNRDQSLVCVVETWQEVVAIEKTKGYNGVYHVLGGVISPLDGVDVEDLTIDPLIERIQKYAVRELILATNQTPEGEATAAYIAKKCKGKNVIISCLARGLPVGSLLESMDRLTVFKALSDRRPF